MMKTPVENDEDKDEIKQAEMNDRGQDENLAKADDLATKKNDPFCKECYLFFTRIVLAQPALQLVEFFY